MKDPAPRRFLAPTGMRLTTVKLALVLFWLLVIYFGS